MNRLPIVDSCDDCGACCMRTPVPPFEPGEEYVKDVPEDLIRMIRERVAADQHFDLIPCVWFCIDSRRCGYYEFRPDACRKFEIGSDPCQLSRLEQRIDG